MHHSTTHLPNMIYLHEVLGLISNQTSPISHSPQTLIRIIGEHMITITILYMSVYGLIAKKKKNANRKTRKCKKQKGKKKP